MTPWEKWILRVKPHRPPFILHSPASGQRCVQRCGQMCYRNQFRNQKFGTQVGTLPNLWWGKRQYEPTEPNRAAPLGVNDAIVEHGSRLFTPRWQQTHKCSPVCSCSLMWFLLSKIHLLDYFGYIWILFNHNVHALACACPEAQSVALQGFGNSL